MCFFKFKTLFHMATFHNFFTNINFKSKNFATAYPNVPLMVNP